MPHGSQRDPASFAPVEEQAVRVNKYLASRGICSRRDADALIAAGRVTINGKEALPGDRVLPTDAVKLDGKLLFHAPAKVVVAYYKPVGVTCTERDPHAKMTLARAFKYPQRLTYAGRLDRDSEGLLLMTNDGDLIHAMMQGSHRHEKEYIVRTRRRLSDADIRQMEKGIYLKELDVTTRPCKVTRHGEFTFSIVLTQGLNRQIRRMCKVLGHEIRFLKRVRVLTVRLGDLKPGEQRTLSEAERQELLLAAGSHASKGDCSGR